MSRTIRKSYFDYSNQSFQKYYDKEIREWTNSKNKKVWIKNKLKHCENIDQVKNELVKCYKMSKTDNIFSDSNKKQNFKNNSKSNIRNYYKKLSVQIIKDEIDVDNLVYIDDYDQKYLKWVWW